MKTWSLYSWQNKKALQQPSYQNQEQLHRVISQLERYPPLVSEGEIDKLRQEIAGAAEGKRFILQGGDCVERFMDCNKHTIENKLKILLQMSIILIHALRKPVTRIGRIAGQFAKPRSSPVEKINGRDLPVYRGDSINSFEPNPAAREAKPERLKQAYFHAALTLNYIRAIIDGGFADLHHPYNWNLYKIERTDKWPQYKDIVENILDAIHFMESFGGLNSEKLGRIDFFTSHESLHLDYETALTHPNQANKFYNTGAHMLWLGERTRQINGAHVEYLRGIANPIGLKLGPGTGKEELRDLLERLNPQNENGRICLVSRLGADMVRKCLPPLIDTVTKQNYKVAWICDPMHGNTSVTKSNLKTRDFNRILAELEQSFILHKKMGSRLAGVHFELTGEDVTECTGGALAIKEADLSRNYRSFCDPRLNYAQSLEMAFLLAGLMR